MSTVVAAAVVAVTGYAMTVFGDGRDARSTIYGTPRVSIFTIIGVLLMAFATAVCLKHILETW